MEQLTGRLRFSVADRPAQRYIPVSRPARRWTAGERKRKGGWVSIALRNAPGALKKRGQV